MRVSSMSRKLPNSCVNVMLGPIGEIFPDAEVDAAAHREGEVRFAVTRDELGRDLNRTPAVANRKPATQEIPDGSRDGASVEASVIREDPDIWLDPDVDHAPAALHVRCEPPRVAWKFHHEVREEPNPASADVDVVNLEIGQRQHLELETELARETIADRPACGDVGFSLAEDTRKGAGNAWSIASLGRRGLSQTAGKEQEYKNPESVRHQKNSSSGAAVQAGCPVSHADFGRNRPANT